MSFFNREDSEKIFSGIRANLKENGKFIFNSWMISEIIIKQFKENFWTTVGDLKCLYNSKYLFSPYWLKRNLYLLLRMEIQK